MITLKTLPQATAQMVFDQVVNHLRAQGKRSDNSIGGCLYRNRHGLKCAAGCLIGDDEYLPEMDSMGAKDTSWPVLVSSGMVPENHSVLISQLQNAHDQMDILPLEPRLKNIALDFELTYTPPINPQEN